MRPIFSPVKNGIFYVIFEKKTIKNQIFGTKLKSYFISLENQPKYDSFVLLMADSDQNLSSHASYTKKEYSGPIPVSQDLFYDVIDPFRNILRILTFENAISSAKSKLFSKFALLLLFK
jgi:hypothetical protein